MADVQMAALHQDVRRPAISVGMSSTLASCDVTQANGPTPWFAPSEKQIRLNAFGFRFNPGGVHLSKTLMLSELTGALDAGLSQRGQELEQAITEGNLLGKRTGSARRLALANLNTLYGVVTPLPVQSALLKLWPRNVAGRPLLALLCALAREPLLRETAKQVLMLPVGMSIRAPDLEKTILAAHPGRYSTNMLGSLARNCASSWTQSGHLRGKVNKRRVVADPSPEAAVYAALLGSIAGYGGPALLQSPWMAVLDRSEADLLLLLRRAESAGLARVQAGGGVVQISVRASLAETLGAPELADR